MNLENHHWMSQGKNPNGSLKVGNELWYVTLFILIEKSVMEWHHFPNCLSNKVCGWVPSNHPKDPCVSWQQTTRFSMDKSSFSSMFYGKPQVNHGEPDEVQLPGGTNLRLVGQASRQSWRWVRLLGPVHATPGQPSEESTNRKHVKYTKGISIYLYKV